MTDLDSDYALLRAVAFSRDVMAAVSSSRSCPWIVIRLTSAPNCVRARVSRVAAVTIDKINKFVPNQG